MLVMSSRGAAPLLALTIALAVPLLLPIPAAAQNTRFLRQPDVSAERIAFVHANDIWA